MADAHQNISAPRGTMAHKFIRPYILTAIILCLLACGCDYYAGPKDIVVELGSHINNSITLKSKNLILEDDCNSAFKVLWGPMKNGDADATYLLATLIMNGMNIVSFRRYELRYVNFLVYALEAKRGSVINHRHRIISIRSELSRIIKENSPKSTAAVDCFSNGNDIEYCEKTAIELGLISDKKAFFREVDGILYKNPKISATCSISAY